MFIVMKCLSGFVCKILCAWAGIQVGRAVLGMIFPGEGTLNLP